MMGRCLWALLRKDCRMMISGKFFLLALGTFVFYTLFINFGYVKMMHDELYSVYLYDPESTQHTVADSVQMVDSRAALESALANDTSGVGIDASGESIRVLLYAATEKADKHRADYALSLLTPREEKSADVIGSNTPEMKQRKEITCELLFIEIVAIGFLGIASLLFKEKQMGVMRVHAVMPLSRSLFICSKLLLFLLTDLVFATLMVLFNSGTVGILPAVLVQTALLSLLMALVGFGCALFLRDFKQFSLVYLVIAIFVVTPVFLTANTSVKMAWIHYHPFYHVYMGMKNAFFGTPATDPLYYLVLFGIIAVLFFLVVTALRREMGKEG